MLIFDAFSRNGVLVWDRACDLVWTGCVVSIEKLWMPAETGRQAAANLSVILAQCPLSCQVQGQFLKGANDFSFCLIHF